MHHKRWTSLFAPAGFLAFLGLAASASAQPVTIPRFDFSFSNPGARSLGFGGAFAALADDATAAYANPAGLVQLAEPEVSLEMRMWKRSPEYLAGGRVDGTPTGKGIDTHEGPVFGRDHSRDFGPSFASVVMPMRRWSFALYGHQLAQFTESTEFQGFFSDEDFAPPFGVFRSAALRETVDLEVTTAGGAAGWRLNDRVSLGLGIVFSDVSLRTRSGAFRPDDLSEEGQFGTITFLPERRISSGNLTVEGTDLTVNAGVLGRISEQLSASLFFRQGAEVEGTADFSFGPAIPDVFGPFQSKVAFKVPDVAGAGLAWRSKGGGLTLAGEADHVGYGDLLQVEDNVGVDYRDAWEFHVGAEYALLRRSPILAFRAGAWVEKDADVLGTKDLTHLAAGFGLAAASYQVDLAGDFSDTEKSASLSVIYTF